MNTPARFCASCGSELPPGSRFCPSCGTPTGLPATGTPVPAKPTVTPKGSTPDAPSSGPHGRADELRPITALFADVVGSTSLGEKLSPEEVKALIGECVGRMSRAVEEFGGTIQAYMGDGICGLFGVPTASEDDPERAARAGLRIIEVIGEYAKDIEAAWNISDFDVRVGINSGQTAVGLVGAGDPQMVALGDTTNVAARLQSTTTPGTIAVGPATAQSLAHRFDFEPLGDIEVKGRDEPVKAWRLEGVSTVGQTASQTRLIGRDVEMSRLQALSQQLGTGRGGVLLLTGETGMGKTRLLGEFRKALPESVTWIEGQCLSYTGGAYLPFVEMLRDWLGVEEGEAEVAVRTKLRARMSTLLGWRLPNLLPFLGRLLSVKLDPQAEQQVEGLGKKELAEELRRSYVGWVEAMSYEQPMVVALEDLHWADGPTRELAEDLLALSDRAPLLVAVTLRPDPASQAWRFRTKVLADFPHRVMELPLRPLPDEAAQELISAVASIGELDETTTKAIVDRAEGNPLYIEELLRSLGESGALEKGGRQWTMTMSAAAVIPAALENLLIARVDNLPPESHRVAQLAAVIGRTFPARVLELLYENNDLDEPMATLLRGQIVREVRRYPELEYTFSHGLIQEAALSTLTLDSRREIYGHVGAAFEELFADSLEERYEILAFYYYRSNEQAKALTYLERAGARAADLGAIENAYGLFERALKVAGRIGDAAAQTRLASQLSAVSQISADRRSDGRSAT